MSDLHDKISIDSREGDEGEINEMAKVYQYGILQSVKDTPEWAVQDANDAQLKYPICSRADVAPTPTPLLAILTKAEEKGWEFVEFMDKDYQGFAYGRAVVRRLREAE